MTQPLPIHPGEMLGTSSGLEAQEDGAAASGLLLINPGDNKLQLFHRAGVSLLSAARSGWFSSCSAGFLGCLSWRSVALQEQDVREPLAPAPLPGQHCRDVCLGTELNPVMFPSR